MQQSNNEGFKARGLEFSQLSDMDQPNIVENIVGMNENAKPHLPRFVRA
jgi:predicted double-glycine peptidase